MKANKFHKITEKQRQQKLVEVIIKKADLKKTSRNYGIVKELVSKLKIPDPLFNGIYLDTIKGAFSVNTILFRNDAEYDTCESYSTTSSVRLECGIRKPERDGSFLTIKSNFDENASYLAVIKEVYTLSDSQSIKYKLIGYFPKEKFEFEN